MLAIDRREKKTGKGKGRKMTSLVGEEAEVGDMLIDDDDDESGCKYVNVCDVYVFIEEKWRSGCC